MTDFLRLIDVNAGALRLKRGPGNFSPNVIGGLSGPLTSHPPTGGVLDLLVLNRLGGLNRAIVVTMWCCSV